MDNVTLNPGNGGAVCASDDVGGVQFQRVKLAIGGEGINLGDISPDNPLPVYQAVTPGLDAFHRQRVSNAVALFSAQCQYNAEPLLLEGGASGTGVAPAHNANSRMVALSGTAGTGVSFLQSYEFVPYQPSRSQLVFVTGVFGEGVDGWTVDVGAFDAANGVFLRQNGTSGLQLVLRSSVGGTVDENVVDQADWDVDPMDGTGPSGWEFNEAQSFIFAFDAQFLGMGRVRCYLDIDGHLYPIHHFEHAQRIATPYMQSLALPVAMVLTGTDAAAGKTCYFKCCAVSSEGGLADDLAYDFSTPEMTVTAGNGTATHLISIRPRTTFNSLPNRIKLRPEWFDLIVTGNTPVRWTLSIGATFSAAPTFSNVNATYSSADYSSTVGTLSGAGLVIASGYVASSQQSRGSVARNIAARYPITLDRAGAVRAAGTLSLCVTGLGGTSDCRAAMTFAEVR
jgi:hypothetical protein